jgi:1-acyl-sn-glycerol-3-phosphate acyltransferase
MLFILIQPDFPLKPSLKKLLSDARRESESLYAIFKRICLIVLLLFGRWKVEGREHVPKEGPLVVVSNHTSYWDPVLVGCALPREVRFMAKAELFSYPILKNILHAVRAFPIKRGTSDRTALRMAIKLLQENEVIGIFPEGTRSKSGTLLPFKSGINMIAYKANSPILPIAVINSSRVLLGWRYPVRVIIGEAISFPKAEERPSKEELEALNNKIWQSVYDLLSKNQ